MAQQTPKLLQKFGRETVGRPDLARSDFPVVRVLKERVPGHFARGMKRLNVPPLRARSGTCVLCVRGGHAWHTQRHASTVTETASHTALCVLHLACEHHDFDLGTEILLAGPPS